MYILNYNKTTMKMFDISKKSREHYKHLEITEKDKETILNSLNNNNECFVNEKTNSYYFEIKFCECGKLKELKVLRDELLLEQDHYKDSDYQEVLLENDGIIVDDVELKAYYKKLMYIEYAYTECTDKKAFQVIFVDEYCEIEDEDETIYELVKPSFIKSK